jgi:hypothetical protein
MDRDTLADATPVGGCARISGNDGKSLDRHRCPGFLDAATRCHPPRTVDSEVPVQDSTEPLAETRAMGSGD